MNSTLIVNDLPQVRMTIAVARLLKVEEAQQKMKVWLSVLRQNLDYTQENPTMEMLGKGDALSAARQIEDIAKQIVAEIKAM